MIEAAIPAYIFCVLTVVVVLFQLALALGAPWGELSMGGKYPGRYPSHMRIAALVQSILLFLIALVVLTRAGVVFAEYFEPAKKAIWVVVAFFVVGAFLNIITPSRKERMLWAPVTVVLLVCSLVVATS